MFPLLEWSFASEEPSRTGWKTKMELRTQQQLAYIMIDVKDFWKKSTSIQKYEKEEIFHPVVDNVKPALTLALSDLRGQNI